MTSTDRAFIAAFHREAVQTSAPVSAAAPSPTRGLPGAGVEVVTFAIPQRPLAVTKSTTAPETKADSEVVRDASTQRFSLHGPHCGVTPLATLRRPLSTLTAAKEIDEFRPTIVVSRLRWPALCVHLGAENPDRLASVLEALGRIPGNANKIVGVAGTERGAGCTTVTLALARQAARLGRRVAVLEADAASPCFADELGISAFEGLAELLLERVTLAQVATYAHDERVAAIPWGSSPIDALDGRQRLQLSLSARRLRLAFDLVLLDLGAAATGGIALQVVNAMHGDGVLLVAPELCPQRRITEIQQQLETGGRPVLGVVENTTQHAA
jgi:Mrp family chromosome partitioning ATPase